MQVKQEDLLAQHKNNEQLEWILKNVRSKYYMEEYGCGVEKKYL